jgi:cytochrome c
MNKNSAGTQLVICHGKVGLVENAQKEDVENEVFPSLLITTERNYHMQKDGIE